MTDDLPVNPGWRIMEELLKQLSDLLEQFEVGGNSDAGSADIQINCRFCPWSNWLVVKDEIDRPGIRLARLAQLGLRHQPECIG